MSLESKHRIFLSHSGCQKDFTQQLCADLLSAGLNPFLDNASLVKGDPALQVVTVVSREYVESKHHLSELAAMIRSGKPVVPVFYDVEPAELRRVETGLFAAAFEKHKSREPPELVREWADALCKLADITGFVFHLSDYNGNEAKLKREVLDAILSLLPSLKEALEAQSGLQEQTEICIYKSEKMYDAKSVGLYGMGGIGKTTLVGLLGMGGIGKTTLAKEMYNFLSGDKTFREDSELETLEGFLGKITPQSLRMFIRAKNPSGGELQKLLQFFGDLLLVANSSDLSGSKAFQMLKSCVNQVVFQIFLEKFFLHFLSSTIVIFFLFEYLMGYIQRGGWATYSDSSWEFRATYVSVELRQAFYFWFHFRACPAPPPLTERGRKRSRAELKGTPSVSGPNVKHKFEPKLKACLRPGEKVRDVWLGEYDTFQEAADAYWIGAFYYQRWDRFSDEIRSLCAAINLPPLPANLSDARKAKASWVREQAEDYVTRKRPQAQGAVIMPHPGVVTEQYLATGCGLPVISGTTEAGSLPPINDILTSWPPSCGDTEFMRQLPMNPHQSGCTGIGLEQVIIGDVSVDDYEVSILPEVGAMSRGETGEHTEPRTFANHTQVMDLPIVAQELQEQNLEDSGAGAEVGAVLQQDESEVQHVLRASANHPQAVALVSQEFKELKCTDAIQSFLGDLIERGWDFEIERRSSTETLSVPVPSWCEGPKFTSASYLSLREIYEQGFKITLKRPNDASVQDGNRRPQSRTQISSEADLWRPQSESISRDLCRSCNARLFPQ